MTMPRPGTRRARRRSRLSARFHTAGCDYCSPSKLRQQTGRPYRTRTTRKAVAEELGSR